MNKREAKRAACDRVVALIYCEKSEVLEEGVVVDPKVDVALEDLALELWWRSGQSGLMGLPSWLVEAGERYCKRLLVRLEP